MKTLILMRHGKSSWKEPSSGDKDRPLSDRGHRSAHALGAWLQENGYAPDTALVSTATRTRQTWDGMADHFPKATAHFLDEMYLASDRKLLDCLKRHGAGTVLMIAHNPGIAQFAHDLAAAMPMHARFTDYPTGATTVLKFDVDAWGDVTAGSGTVEAFTVPRDLT